MVGVWAYNPREGTGISNESVKYYASLVQFYTRLHKASCDKT